MLKVTNKFFLIALIGVATGLVFWPIQAKFVFVRDVALWQALVMYVVDNCLGYIGLSIYFGVWGTFEMKKREATKEH